jgi:hypothetical protein
MSHILEVIKRTIKPSGAMWKEIYFGNKQMRGHYVQTKAEIRAFGNGRNKKHRSMDGAK